MKHLAIILSTFCLSMMQTVAGQQTGDIHKAVYAGDINKVRQLIETDTSLLGSKDKDGKTPLNIACFMIRN